MKITVIPLDSRPCNHSWVEKLAKIGHINLSIFPKEDCGYLHQGLNHQKLMEWLDNEITDTTHLILSVDGFTSGGLIQARQALFDEKTIYERFDRVFNYKKNNPKLQIIVFDTIMRTSITSYDRDTERYWGLMNQYSRLLGKIEIYNNDDDREKLNLLSKQIPQSVIDTYLTARRKKHELNQYLIEKTHEGFFESVVLLQEDSMKDGIQQVEQKILEEMIHRYHLENQVSIYNGTDEGTVVLLAKIICQSMNFEPKVYVHLPNDKILDKIMPFEDRSLRENLRKMFAKIGMVEVDSIDHSDFVLSIYSETEPYDLDLNSTTQVYPDKNDEYYRYIDTMNQYLLEGKKVAFVDLLFPNGGSPEILSDIQIDKLIAYSAWNTASNSLGSCLANMVVCLIEPNELLAAKNFLQERILDDCVYQTVTRRRINVFARNKGINILDLGEKGQLILNMIQDELPKDNQFIATNKYKIQLPWNRTFEIDIDME